MSQFIPVVKVPVFTPEGKTARYHLSVFGIPIEEFHATPSAQIVPEIELRPVAAHYLSAEATEARIEKLLSRITRELRSKEGPFMHDPKSDFWKLPNDQRARVVERLKILEAEAKLEAANSRSKTYGNR